MSQASRWLDGVVTTAWLLGLRGDELRDALPVGVRPPAWLEALDEAATRDERARTLAPHVARLGVALDETRPPWRLRGGG